jgi:sarcosine dehydrogenase
MRDQAQVVIVGGGIIGCSIAYHLTELGWRDVVLIEKGVLTSGSTWHAAGLVGQLRSSRSVTRMLGHSVELYKRLEKETGQATGWKESGCLRLACSEARMLELRGGVTTARSFGLDMHMISRQEAQELFPIMDSSDVLGAAFMPSDGEADPSGLTQALAKGARSRGAEIHETTSVTGFEIVNDRVTAVETDKGRITCEVVVNAAGMWAAELGRMAGVNAPLIPVQHQYLITEEIDGLPVDLPTVRDPDNLLYYKKEGAGLVMGGYEPNPIPWSLDGIPKEFNQELLESDFDHFESISQAAVKRTPCLENAGIRKLVNGPEAFTPDGNCILGPAPELQNFFVAAGFNAFGIASGGGAGRMVAEWIVEGEPSLDIWPLDIRRFGSHNGKDYARDRSLELYGKHYSIAWPFEEHETCRGIKRSPLYGHLKRSGAVFGSKFGWERPNWFAPEGVPAKDDLTFGLPNWFEQVGEEHRAARERVVLIDQSSFSKFEVEGQGAAAFVNRIAANSVDKPTGSVTYTQLCNERGGVECDLTIARIDDERFFIVTGTAFGTHDFVWIRQFLPKDGSVVLRDITSSRAMLNVCGPDSRTLLERVSKDDLSNAAFPFGHCGEITVGSTRVLACRVTYVGELGYELYIPTEHAVDVYENLWESGQDLGITNAGYRAIESLRLEKGYRYWSAEVTPDYTPYESGLGFCVDLAKGDFIGREALVLARENGPKRKMCCFTLDGDETILLRGGETILRDGEVLGVVTSGGYGYTVGKTIAYGFLPVEHSTHTDGFSIEIFTKTYPATRHTGALYDPERTKIQS